MYCSPSISNEDGAATTPVCASIDQSSSPFVARYATKRPFVVPWNTTPPAVASVPAPIVPSTPVRQTSFWFTGSHATSCERAGFAGGGVLSSAAAAAPPISPVFAPIGTALKVGALFTANEVSTAEK